MIKKNGKSEQSSISLEFQNAVLRYESHPIGCLAGVYPNIAPKFDLGKGFDFCFFACCLIILSRNFSFSFQELAKR